MLNLKTLPWIILGVIALIATAYLKGSLDGKTDCDERHKAAAQDEFQRRVAEGESLAGALEMDLASGRFFYRDLERQVQNEIQANDIYRNCILPGSGLFLANSAIKGRPAR